MLTTAKVIRRAVAAAAVVGAVMVGVVAAAPAAFADAMCGHLDLGTGEFIACAGSDSESSGTGSGTAGQSVTDPNARVDPCPPTPMDPQPPPSSKVWLLYLPAGANPADYVMRTQECRVDGLGPLVTVVPATNTPPPNPQLVAREAIAKLPIPLPHIDFGPNAQQVAVNVPVWLWMSNPDSVSASATDRTVTVTATATLASVTWSMGEPDAVDVTCSGGGQAPWAGADLWKPPCGYTYRLRSLDERTNGTGAWPVTAAAKWAIAWSANTGESGTDSVTTRSMAPVRVGEWRTVIVAGN